MWDRHKTLKLLGAFVLLMLSALPTAHAAPQTARELLKLGSSGVAVAELQERLNTWLVQAKVARTPLAVTGYFGKQTEAAVRSFQRARALPVTGVVDEATWAQLPAPATSQALKYFWPRQLPPGMAVDRGRSWDDGTAYELRLARSGARPAGVSIYGGVEGEAPDLPGRQVRVRGLPAMAYNTGAGNSVEWREAGRSYAIMGDLSLPELLALAHDLQTIDRGRWLRSLGGR